MYEILKNLHILSKTYFELYKCCEEISSLYLDLDGVNGIKKNLEHKLNQFSLLQNNLKISGSIIEKLESKKDLY